jgi:hypothetical protein
MSKNLFAMRMILTANIEFFRMPFFVASFMIFLFALCSVWGQVQFDLLKKEY